MLNLSDDYLIGFVEGEGCFYVGIVPIKNHPNRWQIIHFFKVSQNPKGKVVLDYLKKRLGCGYIKVNSSKNNDKNLAFVVRNINDLYNKIVPFFKDKLVVKRKEFKVFSKVVKSLIAKKHLTKQGFKELVDLIYALNPNRKYPKETVLQSYNKRKSSQTIRQSLSTKMKDKI